MLTWWWSYSGKQQSCTASRTLNACQGNPSNRQMSTLCWRCRGNHQSHHTLTGKNDYLWKHVLPICRVNAEIFHRISENRDLPLVLEGKLAHPTRLLLRYFYNDQIQSGFVFSVLANSNCHVGDPRNQMAGVLLSNGIVHANAATIINQDSYRGPFWKIMIIHIQSLFIKGTNCESESVWRRRNQDLDPYKAAWKLLLGHLPHRLSDVHNSLWKKLHDFNV